MLDALAGVVTLLEGVDGIERTMTLAQALARSADSSFSMLIVDLALPDANGTEGIEQLRIARPDVPIVVFSANDDPEMVSAAIDAGAVGYLLKNTPADVVLNALRLVLRGGTYVPPVLADRLMAPFSLDRSKTRTDRGASKVTMDGDALAAQLALTGRQTEVMQMLFRGMPNKLICRELDMAEGTVKTHLNAIYQALGVHTRTQAILKAQQIIGAT
jgi:DNA-binding NarL/FixJ family response regulator